MSRYQDLMQRVLRLGEKQSDTKSLFGEQLTYDLRRNFPVVTSRKIFYKQALAELYCFINGFTDVKSFREAGVTFWDHDCYKPSWSNNPNKRHEDDLGKIYGFQWRFGFGKDQLIELLVNLKSNPESRRHILSTFNHADLPEMCLPPCYISHQFSVREGKFLDMMVHQRSADLCIGVPYDLVNFAAFQMLVANELGLIARRLQICFGDVHIYNSHLEHAEHQADLQVPYQQTELILPKGAKVVDYNPKHVELVGYDPMPPIKYKFMVQS